MPDIRSPYVKARSEAAEQKKKAAAPIIAANAALPLREVAARVNAELQRRGFKEALADSTIRDMRHAARKEKGLPFDGLAAMPPKDAASIRERRVRAIDYAANLLRKGRAVTPSMVQKNAGVGYENAASCLHAAIRKVRQERTNGTTPPVPTPGARAANGPQAFAVNAETRAAMELLTQAMADERIVSITINRGEGGQWGYACTRTITEDATGAL